MKKLAILLTFALVGATSAYLVSTRSDAIPEMSLQRLDGPVLIVRDEQRIQVEDTETIRPGDVIYTSETGRARLRLTGSRLGWLLPQAELAITDESSLALLRGSLRARSEEDMSVVFDGITASTDAAHLRIDQGFGSARASSYSGEVHLAKPGQPRLTLNSLFEAPIAAGDLPGSTRPYRLNDDDEWDDQVLQEEIALDYDLSLFGDGLRSQLGASRPTVGYFSELAGKRVGFMRPYLKRNTVELLIGFSVAENAKDGGLKSAFKRALRLRKDGGRWGVVASILRSPHKQLLADLESIVVGTGAGNRDGGEPEFTLAAATEATGGTSGPTTTTPPGTGTAPADPGGSDKKPSGKGGDDPEPKDCSSNQDPECIAKEIEDTLGGGDPSPSPSPTSLTDRVLTP
ncbi:MAG: hypothetical protein ACR2KQ_05870 [Actinomycetota bacterium]